MATIDSVKLPDNSAYDLADNYSGYQKQTLTTPLTINKVQKTTVEGALGAVNDYADKIKDNLTGRNLLDNGWFNINERGATSGSFDGLYHLSRWKFTHGASNSGSWSWSSGILTLTAASNQDAFITQSFMHKSMLNNKDLTLSILFSDDSITSGTIKRANGTRQAFITTADYEAYFNTSDVFNLKIAEAKSIAIKAIMLEVGKISTLATAIQPSDALELAKCQTSTADPSDTYANQGQLMTSALQGVLGAVNKLVYPYYSSSFTDGGITFMDNGNGTVTVSTSGAASAQKDFWLSRGTAGLISTYLENGTYKLSGCPAGGDISTKYKLLLTYQNPSNVEIAVNDIGDGATFTINGSYGDSNGAIVAVRIIVRSGTTIGTPIVFKPMIHDSRISVPSHVPYAKTNKQLTDDKAERSDISAIHATGSTNTTGSQIDAGTFFYLNGSFCKALTNIAVNATFTLNTNFEVTNVGNELKDALDYSGTYIFNGTPAYEGYGGIIVPAPLPIPANLLSEYSITVTEMFIGRNNGTNISLTIDSRDKYEKNHGGVQAVYTLQNYFGTTSPAFVNFVALRDANASILVKLDVAHV